MESARLTANPSVPTQADFETLSREANQRFSEMNEEDQMLSLLRMRLGYAAGQSLDKEGAYKRLIAKDFGPKFAERVLSDPVCRRKLGLA